MQRQFIIFLLAILFACAGCSTYWYQEGKSFEECMQARQDCINELKKFSTLRQFGDYEFEFMEDCMGEKGYGLVTEDKLPFRVKREEPETSLHWRLRGVAGTLKEQ